MDAPFGVRDETAHAVAADAGVDDDIAAALEFEADALGEVLHIAAPAHGVEGAVVDAVPGEDPGDRIFSAQQLLYIVETSGGWGWRASITGWCWAFPMGKYLRRSDCCCEPRAFMPSLPEPLPSQDIARRWRPARLIRRTAWFVL